MIPKRYRGISEQPNRAIPPGISYGYIILPTNHEGEENRKKYVQNCYRRERVAVLPEKGGTPNFDCFITRTAIKNIYFPQTSTQLGSAVMFMNDATTGHPIVIDVVSKMDESTFQEENVWKEVRKDGDSNMMIALDPTNDQIVISSVNTNKPTKIKINASSLSEDSEISIGCAGNVKVDLSGDFSVKAKKGFLVDVNGTTIDIRDNKVSVKNEIESLKTIIDDFMTQITLITVPTGTGPSGVPVNAAAIQAIKTRLSLIMS